MREFVQQPLDENNVCSNSLIALPTCVSSRWAIIPRNGRHPARHCANMPLAELITNILIMRLGHVQSQSRCVQQHAIAPPLITRKSSRHLLLQSLVLVLKGVGTTHRNQNIHKTKVRSKPSCWPLSSAWILHSALTVPLQSPYSVLTVPLWFLHSALTF